MKIRVQNYQSLRDTEVEVAGLTVVVGKSNLGKSALVRAIEAVLFNQPGQDFVRVGASYAEVCLEDGDLQVVWQKGAGRNQYRINGATYGKVGTGTPDVLQGHGYRDLWIGDADRKRGESLRPQVAGQFEGIFLLSRSGAFIAEVLNAASRLQVLQRAGLACASDLRATKQMLGIRRQDLEAAEQMLVRLQPLVGVMQRIHALAPVVAAVDAGEARLAEGVALQAQRQQLLAAQFVLPEPTVLPPSFAADVDRVSQARTLLVQREALQQAAAVVLPPIRPYGLVMERMGVYAERWRQGSTLQAELLLARRQLQNDLMALRAAQVEADQVEGELARVMEELQVCPICGRGM